MKMAVISLSKPSRLLFPYHRFLSYSVEKLPFVGFWTFPRKREPLKTITYIDRTHLFCSYLRKNRVFQQNMSGSGRSLQAHAKGQLAATSDGPRYLELVQRLGYPTNEPGG